MKRIIVAVFCFFASLAVAFPVIAQEYQRDYRGHHGYRESPYDEQREYGRYDYKGHMYSYHGHWRSWDDWDRYARNHPYLYNHGRYYRDEGHLMFRFCEPDTYTCFFFSIGR
jgi:hypothetical protein